MGISRSTASPVIYSATTMNDNSGFIPAIWSGKMAEKFYAQTVYTYISNTNWQGEIANMGDTVHIQTRPDMTIFNYKVGDTINYEDPDNDLVSLVVNKAKAFAIKADNIDEKQRNPAALNDWAMGAGENMKVAIDTDVLAVNYASAHASNQGATAGATSGNINLGTEAAPLVVDKTNIEEWIADLGQVMDEQNLPNDRKLVLPPALCAKIRKSSLADASYTGDSKSIMRDPSGRLGVIERFELFMSNNIAKVTDVGTGNVSYQVMACTQHAITFASQITEIDYFDKLERTFGKAIRGLNVYGSKVVVPVALVRSCVKV